MSKGGMLPEHSGAGSKGRKSVEETPGRFFNSMRKRDKGQLISGSYGYEGRNRVKHSPEVYQQDWIVFTCGENHYTIHLAANASEGPSSSSHWWKSHHCYFLLRLYGCLHLSCPSDFLTDLSSPFAVQWSCWCLYKSKDDNAILLPGTAFSGLGRDLGPLGLVSDAILTWSPASLTSLLHELPLALYAQLSSTWEMHPPILHTLRSGPCPFISHDISLCTVLIQMKSCFLKTVSLDKWLPFQPGTHGIQTD